MGEQDSEIRRRSSRFLESIVLPAVRKFGFDVQGFVGASFDPTGASIRQSMTNWIQTADICIVDLTGNNANVLFEYGLRLGTGLPLLAFFEKGQKLIYDIDDRPAFSYDLQRPGDAIQTIERYLAETTVEGSQLSVVNERYEQTGDICRYIRRNDPRRIDILQFSLRALGQELFEALWECSDVSVRMVLMHPRRARTYAQRQSHADDVKWTENQVRGLADAVTVHRRNQPTVGLWYYSHEPSIAAVIIDQSVVQVGWYFRDPVPGKAHRLKVTGHNRPALLAAGAAARKLLPAIRSHFLSVLGGAEPASPDWGISGPHQDELRAEWEAARSGLPGMEAGRACAENHRR